jgi:hypothetical protein|tara:strand:+ start:2984 stop:3532 length:549 start_codon:yes stop_codon:yes gene_type:complete
MGSVIKDKYEVIKNFVTEDEINLLAKYCKLKHISNLDSFDYKMSNVNDTMFYGDPLTDSLMLKYKNKIEKYVDKKVLPTYSFWRMYTKGAILKKHTDRKACEISITITLSTDGTDWPIYINDTKVSLDPGDGVIYYGRDLPHWRDEFKGDFQAQCFLHYVDAQGKYKDEHMDRRHMWGTQRY